MKHAVELARAIKKIAEVDVPVFLAVVKSVDRNTNTCDVEYNEMEIGEVRLQAIIKNNTKAQIYYPAVDSVVLVQRLGTKGDFFITMYSEIEEILTKIGDCTLNIKDSFLFQMNDGSKFEIKNGFLIEKSGETMKKIVDDLIDAIMQLTVPTNVGPSGTPINMLVFQQIKLRADQLLK